MKSDVVKVVIQQPLIVLVAVALLLFPPRYVFAAAEGASFPAAIDLSTLICDGNVFLINGTDAGDLSGRTVSGLGDINGDGIDDLGIGAPYASPNGIYRAGKAYVVFGSPDVVGTTLELSALDGTNGFVINGIAVGDSVIEEHVSGNKTGIGDKSGRTVSGTGDINSDGVNDFIIGSFYADPNGKIDAGQSYVIFGSSEGFDSSLELSALDGSNGFTINGINAGDGSSHPAGAGDVNGDGIKDLLIGAHYADPNGKIDAGEAYVVFGSGSGFGASLELSALDGTNGFVLRGMETGDATGYKVAKAGDVNGDGIDDILIGAPYSDPNGKTDAGKAYVVFGGSSGFGASLELSALNGTNGFAINGVDAGSASGRSVHTAGDVNGDGIDDILIGAPFPEPYGETDAGKAYVVFGSSSAFGASLELSALDGTNGFVINGIDAGDDTGRNVSTAGDVNGDGIDDLFVGGQQADPNGKTDAGKAYVVFGSSSAFGASLELSALDGTNGFVINGIDAGDHLSRGGGGAVDIDGDGTNEFYVGARCADPNGKVNAGESYVISFTVSSYKNLLYTPVTPCRIVDTRLAGGPISPGGVRSYNVYGAVASQGGNPATCPSPKGEPRAVVLNVTAVPLSGTGYLTAYPYCSTAPLASLVNYKAGVQPLANSGTVKTCFNCTKDISVKSGSGTAHVVIDVLGYYYAKDPVNDPPTADAGPDQTVDEDDVVFLDGSGSFDSDGSIASYSWNQMSGTLVTLNNADTDTANFTAPEGEAQEDLGFSLRVTDDDFATDWDEVIVTVNPVNDPPVADAGPDQTVDEGDIVHLSSFNSYDSDGTIASYSWTQLSGTVVILNGANTDSPTFTAPGVSGDLIFQLTVTDDDGATDTDEVTVTVLD